MEIDYQILEKSVSEVFHDQSYQYRDNMNFEQCPFPGCDYCSINEMSLSYTFLGYPVLRLGIYVNVKEEFKKVMFSINVPDANYFYESVVEAYGLPESTSLSTYYIESQGYKTPPELNSDSLDFYYENLKSPEVKDFPNLKNLIWYDLNSKNGESSTNMIIMNKSHPQNKFAHKEIWVSFRKSE